MAPSLHSRIPSNLSGPMSPGSRRVSGFLDQDTMSNGGMTQSYISRGMSSKRFSRGETTNISNVVSTLKHRSSDELGPATSSQLVNASYSSLLEWIRSQRMTLLPPEGSDYDKVLAWAQLFIERLHSFDNAIAEFAGDSYLAAQLGYGYCAMLLELGQENATALTASFGFFYTISMTFLNLLERTELFNASHEIREQLVLAFGDLVSLVASISTHFHKAIHGLTDSSPLSIDIYRTFPHQIQTFRQHCEKVSISLWTHQLLKENVEGGRVAEINSIKSWLSPDDRVVAGIADSISHLAHDREEMTCLWMGPYLARFLKGQHKSLAITGKPGSGKTVLASVVVDHLQHSIGGVSYSTLYIPINARIPTGTTPRAIARAILIQLLAKRIGNVQLFQILSDAFKRSKTIASEEEHDSLLWSALESALASSLQGAKELVLVVDGVDESSCGEKVLMEKLSSAVHKASNVKMITFGANKPASADKQACVNLDKELVLDDMHAVTRSHLLAKGAFSELDEMEQETVLSRITEASDGSFLWSKLAVKQAREMSKADDFRKAVETLVTSKPTIFDFVLQAVQATDANLAKMMLLWLATAERPLQVKELAMLASVQVDKLAIDDSGVDVLQALKPFNSLVFLEDDLLYMRHGTIRAAVLDIFSKGKLVPGVKDRHADIVMRMLVYIKSTGIEQREPSLTSMDWHDANILLNKNHMLDFALRYWPVHFRSTVIFQKQGSTGASKEFSKVLPSSTAVVQLQDTVWDVLPAAIRFSYGTMVLSILRETLTLKNVATLQSTVLLAQLLRQMGKLPEAIPLFHQAATSSYSLLTTRSNVTMQMMRIFLDLTADQVSASKTEVMANREECLVLLVECYKVHYGTTSESVVTILRQLSEHYHMIKEVQKAREIETSIKSITHTNEDSSHGTSGNLAVKLQARKDRGPAETGQTLVLDVEYDEEIESETQYDFASSLQLAQKYVSEKRYELAERIFVEAWQRMTDEFRVSASSVAEERQMKAILEYSKFLKTQKRDHEASSILSSFWHDSRQTTIRSETSASYLQEVAKVLKTVGFSTMALSIFKTCSEYYKSTNHTESSVYKELQQSINSTSTEVMQSISSSEFVSSESTLEEIVYEATQSITTVDQTSFTATDKLIQLYAAQHRWRDATRMVKRVLYGIWPSLFAASLEDVSLPAQHVDHCVSLAERLCQCYRSRRRSSKEEDIRVRVYRGLRSGRNVEDKLRQNATSELLRFYDTASQTELIINIHQELLNDYTDHYGPTHAVVVKQLWTLATLTRPRPVFIDYYQQIIQILNKESKTCHPEAFEPVVIVATELWMQRRYADAVSLYKIVFTTFIEQDKLNPRLKDDSFVQEMFNRYTHCLRAVRTEFATLHSITTAYQTKCKAVFGMSASITVRATLTLARVCQESKRYDADAIALYEELLKIKSDVLNHEELSATLETFYEEQAAMATSSTSLQGTISSAQAQQAVKVLRKRVSTVRQTYGWAHEESLSKMEEMVSLYAKSSETSAAVTELNEVTVQVLSSTTSTTALASAATSIASSYIAIGQTQKAKELTEEVYRQIMLKDTSNAKSFRFNLSSKEQHSLVFLAQLQHRLYYSTFSVTELLASLTTELTYFEEFRKQVKTQGSSLHTALLSASRLYLFLIKRNRQDTASRVLVDLKAYFVANEGKRIQCTDAGQVEEFLLTMLGYFSSHQSQDFTRSVGIACNARVLELLKEQRFEAVNNLAIACFRYIVAQKSYRTPTVVKFVFTLGMNMSGHSHGHVSRPKDAATQKKLLSTSSMIIQDALRVAGELKLNLALMDPESLNSLIGLLGEHRDHHTLAWLLTLLWNSREVQRNWQPSTTLALGRRFIMARYLVGDTMAAVRIAEDVAYNCRRVHGARNRSTLDMSVLLSQLYTGIAQKYEAHKGGADLAKRYYKKSASTHENILRAFSDPALADLETNLDTSMSMDGNSLDLDFSDSNVVNPGDHVRQHFQLFKLAVQRLGDWPKDPAEYDRLNADLFREFPEELKGFEGVEKWNLKSFGGGKAESNEDQVDAQFSDWRLFVSQDPDAKVNGNTEEEEL